MVSEGNFVKLISPRVTALVTTVDSEGRVNGAPYSWVYPLSFSPPLVGVGIGGKQKHTYQNAEETGEMVINIVGEEIGQKAVNCERRHSRDENLLEEEGLETVPSEKVRPPRLKQAGAVLECKVKEFFQPKGSDHLVAVGEVVAVHCPQDGEGNIDLKEVDPLLHHSGKVFYKIGKRVKLKRG